MKYELASQGFAWARILTGALYIKTQNLIYSYALKRSQTAHSMDWKDETTLKALPDPPPLRLRA